MAVFESTQAPRVSGPPQMSAVPVSDLLLWQLADSALPTGGFAHSAGLEAAWHHGEVRGSEELASLARISVRQAGRAALPFAMAAHREPHRLVEFDRCYDVFTTNHVANRASRWQGRALRSAVVRIFGAAHTQWTAELAPALGHWTPMFGACLRGLQVDEERTSRLFLFLHLRSLLSSAVRLNIVGPLEAQALQHRLATFLEQIRAQCSGLSLSEIAQPAPLLDLWQGAHDRLYSRLFQS